MRRCRATPLLAMPLMPRDAADADDMPMITLICRRCRRRQRILFSHFSIRLPPMLRYFRALPRYI